MSAHTGWCAKDHRCNLAEHRSDEIVVDLPGTGRAVLTRVQGVDGREHAEIRMRVALAPVEAPARWQLWGLLRGLHVLVTHYGRTPVR